MSFFEKKEHYSWLPYLTEVKKQKLDLFRERLYLNNLLFGNLQETHYAIGSRLALVGVREGRGGVHRLVPSQDGQGKNLRGP